MDLRPTRVRLGLAGLITLTALFLTWWYDAARYAYLPKRLHPVTEAGLWRSGQLHPRLLGRTLDQVAPDLVIDLDADNDGRGDDLVERAALASRGIRRAAAATLDGSGIGDAGEYAEALGHIRESARGGERVLVHCAAGTQRTGATVMLHRVLFEGWPAAQAWDEYEDVRGRADEDGALAPFLDAHIREIAAALVASGHLEQVPAPLPRFSR